MNGKILVVTTVILVAAILITPVLAIGPFKALDVGKNKNLEPLGTGVLNQRGEDYKGAILWMMGASGEHWVKWEWQDAAILAKGIMNNAIIAEYSGLQGGMMPYLVSLGENENKWIYLSGDGATYPGQYTGSFGTHGMLWWFWFAMTWAAKYAEVIKSGGTPQAANAAGIAAGIAAGNQAVTEHPQGIFWKTNEISGSLP
jgi:hypothetical protein